MECNILGDRGRGFLFYCWVVLAPESMFFSLCVCVSVIKRESRRSTIRNTILIFFFWGIYIF